MQPESTQPESVQPESAQPESVQPGPAPPETAPLSKKTLEERKAILAQQIQMAVVQGGRVESQSDNIAVVVRGKPVNHLLHFLIGVFTCGLWWIAWLVIAITGGEKRQMITVDEFGNVLVQRT